MNERIQVGRRLWQRRDESKDFFRCKFADDEDDLRPSQRVGGIPGEYRTERRCDRRCPPECAGSPCPFPFAI